MKLFYNLMYYFSHTILLHTLQNISNGGYGGAIIAALYLDEFVGVSSKPADSSSSSSSSSSSKPTVKSLLGYT
jgi:hypothetical protein